MKPVNRSMTTPQLKHRLNQIEMESCFELPTVQRDFLVREKARIQAILKERASVK